MKWRNSKERELLASGGSRDQTLPNKNNPNPDLSDARNDRPVSLSPPSSSSQVDSPIHCKTTATKHKHKSPDEEFPTNTYQALKQKFDFKNSSELKYEFDENNQKFSNFSFKEIIDGTHHSRSNSSSSEKKGTNLFDEYNSQSDSDEEINVT